MKENQSLGFIETLLMYFENKNKHPECHLIQFCMDIVNLFTHCILNRPSHTMYRKSPISSLGTSGYEIYIFLEKNC